MRHFPTYLFRRVNVLLTTFLCSAAAFAQPSNNSCANPISLCPNQITSATNSGANATVCPDCEDDFNFCFSGTNTVWFNFTTNTSGGDVTLNFSTLVFNTDPGRSTGLQAAVFQQVVPCNASTYTIVSNCEAGATGNFSLTAAALLPSTTYLVVVNGATIAPATLPAEASFDILPSGPGIDRPVAGLTLAGPFTACPKQQITFTAYLNNCQDSTAFIWSVNGVVAAVTSDTTWTTSEIEDGDVVTVASTCFADCPQPVSGQIGPIAVENLQVDAGPDQTIAAGQEVILSGSTNGMDYYWTPANTLATPSSLTTIAIPQQTTSYFFTAFSTNCTLSDEVIITVGGQFVIPGSFSPNGDGVNDSWIISGIDMYPNANVQIFDRWGQEISTIVGYSSQKTWDGTKSGNRVTDGTYFYVIDLRDEDNSKPLKGYVTVLR